MKEFLKKLKLIRDITTELDISQNDFVRILQSHVDQGSTSAFSDFSDIFSSSKNQYKGYVTYEEFEIKRKKRFMDMNMNLSIARGKYIQKHGMLIIQTEINGVTNKMIGFYVVALAIYILLFPALIFSTNGGQFPIFVYPFMIVHAAFMLGLPYIFMRKSAQKMAYDLDRDFYYITKNRTEDRRDSGDL